MPRLFKFLNKNNENNMQSHQVQVEIIKNSDGFELFFYREKKDNLVSLPLKLTISEVRNQQNISLLELIEELWLEGFLEEHHLKYTLSFSVFNELPIEAKQLLKIPEISTKLKLKLSHEGAVGTSHFKLLLEKDYTQWKNIERTSRQIGPWIQLADGTELLMDEEQYKFQLLISDSPNVKDKDKIFSYVAKIRKRARELNIPMDNYLEKQEYLFIDNFDVDVSYNGQEIELKPKYISHDDISDGLLDAMSKQSLIYAPGQNNEKIFVSDEIGKKVSEINKVSPINKTNVPKFVENPEAFLPDLDGFDISVFSDRVKSLGIQVYHAQPFVHANKSDRGWFDIDYGFSVNDETGESHGNIQSDEIENLVNEAKSKGEEYIEWNGSWLKIPNDADTFMDATRNLESDEFNKQLDVTKLPYILEIFENISQLEYNQPILEAQQEMKDLGILEEDPPSSFVATLKPFQTDGFVWMKSLYYRRLGGLLADDMGLGKTIQVISLLSFLQDIRGLTPSLIVVPKTLMENWVKEMKQFAPLLLASIHIHQGSNRAKDPLELKKTGITITTYHILVRDQLIFGQVNWEALICDEAQAIKNPSTSASRVIKAMKTRFRLALTGTPVENGLSELWSIMDYVQPGLLGSLNQFKQEFVKEREIDGDEDIKDLENKLIKRMSKVYKRRTKSTELAGQLPSKEIVRKEVPLGKVQLDLYREILTFVENGMMDGLQAIQKLKALSSHPALINKKYMDISPKEVPKLQETLQIISKIQHKDEKVIIFTEYRDMQIILRNVIRNHFDINPSIINGATSQRQDIVDWFNSQPGFNVMILSPKAAGTGLTITSANHVIHYTRWWNPAVENQATDRIYRIGQTKPVFVYYPIVIDKDKILKNGTVEQIVNQILLEKQELATSVIVPSKKIKIEDEILKGITTATISRSEPSY